MELAAHARRAVEIMAREGTGSDELTPGCADEETAGELLQSPGRLCHSGESPVAHATGSFRKTRRAKAPQNWGARTVAWVLVGRAFGPYLIGK